MFQLFVLVDENLLKLNFNIIESNRTKRVTGYPSFRKVFLVFGLFFMTIINTSNFNFLKPKTNFRTQLKLFLKLRDFFHAATDVINDFVVTLVVNNAIEYLVGHAVAHLWFLRL